MVIIGICLVVCLILLLYVLGKLGEEAMKDEDPRFF